MTKKYIAVLMFALAVAILPALSSAAKAPIKRIAGTEKRIQIEKGAIKNNVKDLRDIRKSSSTDATTTKINREEARVTIFALASGLQKNIAREINQAKNLIARLTGANSIVAKLDAKGVNTTAIKAKLADASTLADKAQTELAGLKDLNASSTASTTAITLKTKIAEARKILAQAHTDIKTSVADIRSARKLIAQIPGIKAIESGNATSSPSASSTSATTSKTN